ncbi:hypothetical protein Dsin_003121 [Dipteronia sinensis]|uniref:adenine phosphoribosyltransferase n=1 Tax=Dipteronia sinensis TaxID=43782 RepID=A0AAE0B8F0_9ROSI|nr:hypothetical protein Dsin_003121 [Dipteronia sinensis]
MNKASLLYSSKAQTLFASTLPKRLCRSIAAPSSVQLPLYPSQTHRISSRSLRCAASGDSAQARQMAAKDGDDTRIARISSAIRVIPDFPKPGILFQDITTLLLDPRAFRDTIDLFVERYKDKNISVVAGIEARGFIFGPPIALAIGAKFVPMRKPKKLPGEVISEEYSLEYGTDVMEMHVGAVQAGERALIVDDLIATGGTLCAAIRLLGNAENFNFYINMRSGVACLLILHIIFTTHPNNGDLFNDHYLEQDGKSTFNFSIKLIFAIEEEMSL